MARENKSNPDKKSAESSGRTADGRFTRGNKHGYQPGQTGNPGGSSKAQRLSVAYRRAINQPLPDDPTRTYADLIADALVGLAVGGDVSACRELADRTEGKPRQSITIDDDRNKSILGAAIEQLVATGMGEDEAREYLATFLPEAQEWIN